MMKYLFVLLLCICTLSFGSEVLILIGSPGAGKGSFALYAKTQGYAHISAGDVIREEIANQTPIGVQIASVIERGDFIDSDILFHLVQDRVRASQAGNVPVIIDGYGRKPSDWEQLKAFLKEIGAEAHALLLDAPSPVCKARMMERLVCVDCGYISHPTLGHQEGDICPACQRNVLGPRLNDTEPVIDKRLKQYRAEIEPLLMQAFADLPFESFETNHSLDVCLAHYAELISKWAKEGRE